MMKKRGKKRENRGNRKSLFFVVLVTCIFILSLLMGYVYPVKKQILPSPDLKTQITERNSQIFSMNSKYQEMAKMPTTYQTPIPSDMVSVARQRKELMLQLIEQNPKSFLELSITDTERNSMPYEVKENVEFSIEKQGSLEVLIEDDFVNNKSKTDYYLNENGIKSSLHFADSKPEGLISSTQISLDGIQLDDKIALYRQSTGSYSGMSVLSVPDLKEFNQGEQKTIVILVDFLDDGEPTSTPDQVRDGMFNDPKSINAFYKEVSYGKTWLTGDVVGWLEIPETTDNCNGMIIQQKAIEYADSQVYFPDYRRIIIINPNNPYCYSSSGSVGLSTIITEDGPSQASISRINSDLFSFEQDSPITNKGIAHELGHNFGLLHALHYDCGNFVINNEGCIFQEYGDVFDVMGYPISALHFNAFYKQKIGWLSNQNKITITQSGMYIIYPVETNSENKKELEIPLSSDIPTPWFTFLNYYSLEYRNPIGFDASLKYSINYNGVILRAKDPIGSGDFLVTSLLDTTPNSYSQIDDFLDSILLLGNTFHDSFNGVYITPIRLTDDGGIEVEVRFDACTDGKDNDEDGMVDLQDPGCLNTEDIDELNYNVQCDDGIDNDNDRNIDYPDDFGCMDVLDNFEYNPACIDEKDNDDDIAIDYPNDFSCGSASDDDETNPKAQCQDNYDNDEDGGIDYPQDLGCNNQQDNDESGTIHVFVCSDGIDNDNDGAIDYGSDLYGEDKNDDGCYSYSDISEEFDCNDALDNNDNGFCDYGGCEIDGEIMSAEPGCCNEQNSNRENPDYDGPSTCGDPPITCGDGYCAENYGEDCNTCPQDCGECDIYGYGTLQPSPPIAEESIWKRIWTWFKGLF